MVLEEPLEYKICYYILHPMKHHCKIIVEGRIKIGQAFQTHQMKIYFWNGHTKWWKWLWFTSQCAYDDVGRPPQHQNDWLGMCAYGYLWHMDKVEMSLIEKMRLILGDDAVNWSWLDNFCHFFTSDKRLAYKNFKGRFYWKNGTLDSINVQL